MNAASAIAIAAMVVAHDSAPAGADSARAARMIQSQQPAAAAAVDRGKQLFMTYYCYSCHGTQGHGGAGPRLVVGASPEPLIRYVRKPTGGGMPAYTSKSIADDALRDIHAYLRSIPASPAATSIPMLQR